MCSFVALLLLLLLPLLVVDMPHFSQSLRTNASTCVLRDDRITVPRVTELVVLTCQYVSVMSLNAQYSSVCKP